MNGITGKVAVVTGAGSGIGRATARRLAAEAAAVALLEINPDAGEAAVAEIRTGGGRAVFVRADATGAEQIGPPSAGPRPGHRDRRPAPSSRPRDHHRPPGQLPARTGDRRQRGEAPHLTPDPPLVGRFDGHQWGISWPPLGRNRWPLTSVGRIRATICFDGARTGQRESPPLELVDAPSLGATRTQVLCGTLIGTGPVRRRCALSAARCESPELSGASPAAGRKRVRRRVSGRMLRTRSMRVRVSSIVTAFRLGIQGGAVRADQKGP
jgi:hypothetical protein